MATQHSRAAARLMISPAVLLLLGWMLIPLAMTIYFSFLRYNLLMPGMEEFTGWTNYRFFLTDPAFFSALTNTLLLVGGVLLITVIGGTLNQTGALVIVADKVGRDTMLARIVQMVADAQRSRAPIQRLADVVAGYFVPAVIAVAILAFIAWAIWGPAPALSYALISAVAVLIEKCRSSVCSN